MARRLTTLKQRIRRSLTEMDYAQRRLRDPDRVSRLEARGVTTRRRASRQGLEIDRATGLPLSLPASPGLRQLRLSRIAAAGGAAAPAQRKASSAWARSAHRSSTSSSPR